MHPPNLGDEVIDVVPGDRAVCDAPPPAHAVRREDVRVCVEVVGDGDFGILEWRGDETDAERLARAAEVGSGTEEMLWLGGDGRS